MDFDLKERTILLTTAGSRAYGIHTSTSDVDVKGIAIPPSNYYTGFLSRFEQADKASHIDVFRTYLTDEEHKAAGDTKVEGSVYEIRKFFSLATDCNPNILDVLFCRDEEVRKWTRFGQQIREKRDLFVSAKAKFTFSGYAHNQLQRIKGHREWLLNPPKSMPTRADFGLPEKSLIPKDQLLVAQDAVKKQIDSWELDLHGLDDAQRIQIVTQLQSTVGDMRVALGLSTDEGVRELAAYRHLGMNDDLIDAMGRERAYLNAKRYFKQYEEWKKTRNPDRAALEAKHGYDTKHGAHLVRLLRMGREILETGKVNVWRGDRDALELREIRAGAWSYDKLIEWADAEDKALDLMYREKRYVVPHDPDRKEIDRLCVDIVGHALTCYRFI